MAIIQPEYNKEHGANFLQDIYPCYFVTLRASRLLFGTTTAELFPSPTAFVISVNRSLLIGFCQ